MDYKGKGISNFVLACFEGIIAWFLFSYVAEKEGEWTFIFDESAQDEVKIMTILAWVLVVGAVAAFIEAVVYMTKAGMDTTEEAEKKENTQKETFSEMRTASQSVTERFLNGRENAASKDTVECIFCGTLTAKGHPFCQHCGRRQD